MLRSLVIANRSPRCRLSKVNNNNNRRVLRRPLPPSQLSYSLSWTSSGYERHDDEVETVGRCSNNNNNNYNSKIQARSFVCVPISSVSCLTTRCEHGQHCYNQKQCYSSFAASNIIRRREFDHRHRLLSSAFVSRHNNSLDLSADSIIDYCRNHGASVDGVRTTGTHVVLRECPFCSKPTRNEASNLYKIYIQIVDGAYFCHRCGKGGSWYDLKSAFGGFHVERGLGLGGSTGGSSTTTDSGGGGDRGRFKRSSGGGVTSNSNNKNNNDCLPMPKPPRISGYYSSRLLDQNAIGDCSKTSNGYDGKNNEKNNYNNDALRYLIKTRGLDIKTLRKYGVGRAEYEFPKDEGVGYQKAECITFPWIMRESDIQMQESLRGGIFSPTPVTAETCENDDKIKDGNTNPKTSSLLPTSKKEKNKIEDSGAPTGDFFTRRIKVRALKCKSWQRMDPPGGGWGLFGLHTVPDDASEIVLTEGEYDAMAVHLATGRPAMSLPNGCRSLPVQVLPLLERFKKIYLWMDNDQPGREGAEKFAKKLGMNRTYIVQCQEAKDANDALLRGDINMNKVLDSATLLQHDRIITFKDLREDVLLELLEPEQYTGTSIPSLPRFSNIIKGFRRGEMTVLTGPTGSGKTTFLGQISVDLAEQGDNVLWGSFEIKNTRLLHKLMKQFSRDNLPTSTDTNAQGIFKYLADRFETLPLYFMRFHGGSDVDEVLDAMEYAVYVNDVQHIILDNMQFMITRNNRKSSWDKFEVQDLAIEKFRQFATKHHVHVTLVVHPRKEDESSKLSMSSFFGSAKATQEADTVIIIQNDASRRKTLDVKKNRFDGTLGSSPIYFQSKSGRYVEEEHNAGGRTVIVPPPKKNYGQPQTVGTDIDNHWDKYLSSTNGSA